MADEEQPPIVIVTAEPDPPPPPVKPVPVLLLWWRQYWYDTDVFTATNRTLFKQAGAMFGALVAMGIIDLGGGSTWKVGLAIMAIVLGIPTQPVTKAAVQPPQPKP